MNGATGVSPIRDKLAVDGADARAPVLTMMTQVTHVTNCSLSLQLPSIRIETAL